METDRSGGSWNQRYRENLEKIKSGDLHEVAKVMKTLICRDKERGLSTGERKLLRSAKQILISEMVLVMESDYRNIEDRIHEAVAGGATE